MKAGLYGLKLLAETNSGIEWVGYAGAVVDVMAIIDERIGQLND